MAGVSAFAKYARLLFVKLSPQGAPTTSAASVDHARASLSSKRSTAGTHYGWSGRQSYDWKRAGGEDRDTGADRLVVADSPPSFTCLRDCDHPFLAVDRHRGVQCGRAGAEVLEKLARIRTPHEIRLEKL